MRKKINDDLAIHAVMAATALVITVAALVLHFFQPQDLLYTQTAVLALGFLFGKATNGFSALSFRRPPTIRRTNDEDKKEDKE